MSVNHITVWTSASNLTICGQDKVETPSCEFWSTGYTKQPFLSSVLTYVQLRYWKHKILLGLKFTDNWSVTQPQNKNSSRDSSYHKNEALVEIKNHSLSSRVSLFYCNTRDISRSRFADETRARNVTCIPIDKARRDLNASDAVFPPLLVYYQLVLSRATSAGINLCNYSWNCI